jgi:hypothetical protein
VAFFKFTEDCPATSLRADEYVACQGCETEFNAWDIEDAYDGRAEAIWSPDYHRPQCPACLTFATFVKRRRRKGEHSWSERWGSSACGLGVVPVATVLIRHLPLLGLDATDLGLMTVYESYRRNAEDATWSSQATVAGLANVSERTVREYVGKWVKADLYERERTHRRDGTRGNDRLTRRGLIGQAALRSSRCRVLLGQCGQRLQQRLSRHHRFGADQADRRTFGRPDQGDHRHTVVPEEVRHLAGDAVIRECRDVAGECVPQEPHSAVRTTDGD